MSAAAVDSAVPFLEVAEEAGDRLPGAGGWLGSLRREALDRYRDRGFPGARDEAWRFLNLRGLRRGAFAFDAGADPRAVEAGTSWTGGRDAVRAVFVNGILMPGLSRLPAGDGAVSLRSFRDLLREDGARLREHLDRVGAFEDHPFSDLNTALHADGALLRLTGDAEAEGPIHLLFLADGRERSTMQHPRVLVLAENGARGTLIEEYAGVGGEATFTNAVTEIRIGDNAALDHVKVQREPEAAYHIGAVGVRLERAARYRGTSLAVGAALSRTDIAVRLEGEGAECRLDGLYALGGKQVADHHTYLDHAVPHTSSNQLYKGVLIGRSRGVFNGRILIREGAQQTVAEQVNPNLLLSDTALVNTNPQLKIYADDVKCRHGATIGQLDEDRVFYLRSRGLGETTARRLLVKAFSTEIVDEIPSEPLRRALVDLLAERYFADV